MDTIIEMAGYFFVNCMVTISAVAFSLRRSTCRLLLITDLDAAASDGVRRSCR